MNTYHMGTKCVQGGYTPGNGEPRQVPSSKIRNAFICSPYPFVILFYSQKRGTLGVFSIPERPHFLKL